MERVRIGMVGCGAVSDLYMPVFKYLEEGEVVAVVDMDEARAKEMLRKTG